VKLMDDNIQETLNKARLLLKDPSKVSHEVRSVFSILLSLFELLLPKLIKTTSKNSSLPPSQDPNRPKKTKADESLRKPGGQPRRLGKNLVPFQTVDEVILVPVDKEILPKGRTYTRHGIEKRQVVELKITSFVLEYQLEVLKDDEGKLYKAIPPEGVTRPIQYGNSIKAMAVYLNQFQLLPYARVLDFFKTQANIPLSLGSLCNFNEEAFNRLEKFEEMAKEHLINSPILQVDETGINVGGKNHWLHNASNDRWTLFFAHPKRGGAAMDDMGILPAFKGTLMHDHLKAYFTYSCKHALCHAHHLREFQAVIETHPTHTWACQMKDLLLEINKEVQKVGTGLSFGQAKKYSQRYNTIVKIGDREAPPSTPEPGQKKRGRPKQTKERNLLLRFQNYKKENLRFMVNGGVPFTNNLAERDLRMTKVQQKISGCFKTIKTAQIFCRIRSFLNTCNKQDIQPKTALEELFQGQLSILS